MFLNAKPIWLTNEEKTKNLQVGFRCDFDADKNKKYVLKITGATFYRIFVNGNFVGYGPARAAHGYFRIDEIAIDVVDGVNKIAIEVAGYNCSSFYTLPIQSFLCAELLENDIVIRYTGNDFKAVSLEKLRNKFAYRYSYQRAYTEVWNFDNSNPLSLWTKTDKLEYENISEYDMEETFIPRMVPYPDYDIVSTDQLVEMGQIFHKPLKNENIRYVSGVSENIDGYLPEDITDKTIYELYGEFKPKSISADYADKSHLKKDEYVIYKLPFNDTGFLINNIKAIADSSVYIFFAEHNYGNGMVFESFEGQINIVKYKLKKSVDSYQVETFEPYTCQYIGIAVIDGEIEIDVPKIREYSYPKTKNIDFKIDNDELKLIYAASVQTFRQNTLDVFMDCPGRERSGWLCDSYFTAQAEKLFTGSNTVENVFLDNFRISKEFPNIPHGMLPMVYPSDIKEGNEGFIPQWAMWYVVELGEYCTCRAGVSPEPYRKLCYELLAWLLKYENEDGLLESMPGWNFVEWSKANEWVQDINYPSNMLYVKMLSVMGQLFNDNNLISKSKGLKNKIIEQSFDGEYFVDNAVRKENGDLEVTSNRSETCQYYAYFFDIVDMGDIRFENLTQKILNVFGPERKKRSELSEIAFSNAFIGNYLRIIILLRLNRFDKVIDDIRGYFLDMASLTGTLWEYDDLERAKKCGSLNHGFASFAGVAMVYALSGIGKIDYFEKKIQISEEHLSGFAFSVVIKTTDGDISIYEKDGNKKICLPKGWSKLTC